MSGDKLLGIPVVEEIDGIAPPPGIVYLMKVRSVKPGLPQVVEPWDVDWAPGDEDGK